MATGDATARKRHRPLVMTWLMAGGALALLIFSAVGYGSWPKAIVAMAFMAAWGLVLRMGLGRSDDAAWGIGFGIAPTSVIRFLDSDMTWHWFAGRAVVGIACVALIAAAVSVSLWLAIPAVAATIALAAKLPDPHSA